MGTSGADFALEEAATSGPRAVRKIAKAALAEPASPRRRKDQSTVSEEPKAREDLRTPEEVKGPETPDELKDPEITTAPEETN